MADDDDLDPDLQSEILADNSAEAQSTTSAPHLGGMSPDTGQYAPPKTGARPGIDPGDRAQLPSSSSAGRAPHSEDAQDNEEEADLTNEAHDGDDDSNDMLAALARMQKQRDQQQESSADGEGRSESGSSTADGEQAKANQPSRQSSANSEDLTDGLADKLESLLLDSREQGKHLAHSHVMLRFLCTAWRFRMFQPVRVASDVEDTHRRR